MKSERELDRKDWKLSRDTTGNCIFRVRDFQDEETDDYCVCLLYGKRHRGFIMLRISREILRKFSGCNWRRSNMSKLGQRELEAMETLGEVPDYRDAFAGADLRSFSHYLEQRIEVASTIETLEKEKKRLDDEIRSLLEGQGIAKVAYEGRPVGIVQNSGQPRINAKKLLLAGVTATVIENCTDRTPYSYLLIGKKKE